MKFLLLLLIIPTLTAAAQQFREVAIPTRITNPAKKFLLADLYISDSTVRKPVILIQTPYNKALYRLALGKVGAESGAGIPYDSANYNYVTVDWRGFYANKDVDSTLYSRGLDGYDIVEWIAEQPWSNGKIGTWGGSALGQIQFQTAAQQPPHLVCAAPFIKDFKTKYNDFYYGGDYRKEHVQSLVKLGFTTEQLILTHPTQDSYWKLAENLTDMADKIAVPLFMCSGWFDHFPDDVLRAFDDVRTNSAAAVRQKHKLLFGPWLHTSVGISTQGILDFPNAAGIPIEMGMKFFDYYLRGEKNGWDAEPVVRYYQMGENAWHTGTDWQSAAKGKATLYFHEQKKLSFEPPPITFQPIPPDTLRADPRNPVPTIGGSRFNPFDKTIATGPQDIAGILARTDILSYSTEPLTNEITINGTSEVKFHFVCNRKDADISVRLCDIFPDGKWVILTQGIKRLRLRNSLSTEQLLTPGAQDSAIVELSDLAMTFQKGHRIGLVISGSNYPMFDINPNTGDKLYSAGDTLTAETYISLNSGGATAFTFTTGNIISGVEEKNETMPLPFQVFPNPATNEAHITFGAPQSNVVLTLTDMLGNIVVTQNYNGRQAADYTVPTENLPPGIYTIRAATHTGIQAGMLRIVR